MLGDRFETVLHAAAGGDQEAFGQLWRSAHPPLLRYLQVMCGDSADDVASETWLRAIGALDRFQGDENAFRGWLVVIARNHFRDLARRAARHREVLSPDLTEHLSVVDPADTAESVLERRGTAAALRLVATLPPDQAELVDPARGGGPGRRRRRADRRPEPRRRPRRRPPALRTLAGRLRPTTAVTPARESALGRRDA